jgi:hypothetical protein
MQATETDSGYFKYKLNFLDFCGAQKNEQETERLGSKMGRIQGHTKGPRNRRYKA